MFGAGLAALLFFLANSFLAKSRSANLKKQN
jgi:hypothetical protein